MSKEKKNSSKMDENSKYKEGVNKNARLIVRNISYKATEDELREHFSSYGDVEEVKLLRRPDGKLVGCGFVHYTHVPMANAALKGTNKKPFLGRPITVAWAIDKDKYTEKLQANKSNHSSGILDDTQKETQKEDKKVNKKQNDQPRINRNARLIVRNISFKATEETLKAHFKPYGDILEVKILKKPDGKMVGCAFVHFKNVPMAKEAIDHTNMKPYLGRPISVDWAVPKNKYMQHKIEGELQLQEDVKVKEEDASDDEEKPALDVSNDDLKQEIKSESESGDDSDSDSDDEKPDVKSESDDDDAGDDDDDDDDDEEDDDEEMDDGSETESTTPERKRVLLKDAEDGRTVFVANIPFSVDNDQLRAFAEKTGEVCYALVCVDSLTEHSRGTGFVKFMNADDASRFLSLEASQLRLEGQELRVRPALNKEHLNKDSKKQPKDNRNLYLVKEGVIAAGSTAAVGVSRSDMTKRLALEKSKTQMLRNLNRFVSRYRLVVSNLPTHYDDTKLRTLCSGHGAVVTECRVMRDLRAPLDQSGKHPSKGYGFVMFTKHEDALACLRRLNNNPDVFDKNNRPICSFSIEDRQALNARKKRLEKSIANNPLANKADQTDKRKRKYNGKPDETNPKKQRFDKGDKPLRGTFNGREGNVNFKGEKGRNNYMKGAERIQKKTDFKDYTGITAKQGTQHNMRSNFKLKKQAELHFQNSKLEKKKGKKAMMFKKAAKERVKQPKQQVNKKNRKDMSESRAVMNILNAA